MTKELILKIVNDYSGLDITKKTKKTKYVLFRWIFYKMAVTYTKEFNIEIGNFVNKDHASVYNAMKKYDNELLTNKRFFEWHKEINEIIYNKNKFSIDKEIQNESIDSVQKIKIIENKYNTMVITKDSEIKELQAKINKLESELKNKKKLNTTLQNIVSDLKNLPNETLKRLHANRITPFIRMNS